MNQIKTTTPAIVVHGVGDALAAVAAAREIDAPLTLISAPGAAAYAGPGWFLEIVAQSRAAAPGLAISGVLDCGDHAGHAMAALRAGAEAIVFTGDDGVAGKLSAIARETSAVVHCARPPAFDPGDAPDNQAACREWLSRR
jgi:fructose/tagatose bisphosphate aldolase